MKFNFLYILFLILLCSCVQDMENIKVDEEIIEESPFSSKGFALIYEDSFFNELIVDNKLNEKEYYVLHSFLENDVIVTIYNPLNSNSLTAKVKKTSKYPPLYNIVITKKMASDLDLDINNPYVEVVKNKKNIKFIAKKAKIFEEEKTVADKAPVTSISINDLSTSELSSNKKYKNLNTSYIINIAEFYYYDSALGIKERFEKEANLSGIKLKEVSKTKFKVYAGPYPSFNSMKEIYLSLYELGFEELEIINIK